MGVRNGRPRAARVAAAGGSPAHANGAALTPTVASFFSGIGGCDLGFQQAGFRITYQCEINPFCRSILQKHWPLVPRTENIKDVLDPGTIPSSEVWVGGFPCQDVSV